jgi:hypothetical protein
VKARDIGGHFIKANHRVTIPHRVLVFDTETEPSKVGEAELQRMKIAWSVYAEIDGDGRLTIESWNYWTARYQLMRYINGLALDGGELWIVGNNVYFDLQASDFFLHFARWGWKLDFFYDSSFTYILIARCGRAIVKCVSLTNYLMASVKDLGEMLGNPKIECDPLSAPRDELSIYCFRDTEITLDSFMGWCRFIIDNGLGNFSLSRASQSMAAFRHRFMKTPILVHTEKDVQELEGRAYFGGRTEAFFIGKVEGGPFVHLDVNSLYPFIMKAYGLPTALNDVFSGISVDDCVGLLSNYEAVAHVEIETDTPLYAVRDGEKVIFPIGRFDAYVCTEGLRQAIMRGHLCRVHKLAAYRFDHAFSPYVDYFYAMRQESKASGDKVTERNAKLMLNSLYGKFAQKRPAMTERQECPAADYFREEAYDLDAKQNLITTRMLGVQTVQAGEEYAPGSCVAIPAHVTEFGRMLLWSIIEGIGPERVIYCDTDSVIIRESDLPRVKYPIDPGVLGALKMEDRYTDLEIIGAKDYRTDHTRKLKGIPESAEELAPNLYRFPVFLRQASHLSRRVSSGYIIEETTKRVSGDYDKGYVEPDGRVTPFILPFYQLEPSLRPGP